MKAGNGAISGEGVRMIPRPPISDADPDLNRELQALAVLLRERLVVIGDAASRAADPDAHLRRLQAVGEAIFAAQDRLKGRISFQLEHFLQGCSYDKALALIETGAASCRR